MKPFRPWAYALTYMASSIGFEIFLLVVCRLRIPEDNRYLASLLLTVVPVSSALLARYRRPRELAVLLPLTVVLTVAFVAVYSGITGDAVGLLEPFVVRTAAGFVAASLTLRWVASPAPRVALS